MNDVQIRVPRRPLLDEPGNQREDWLSGELTVRHEDGRLRRAKTLWKYAWCLALVGRTFPEIVAGLEERDRLPEYRKFTKGDGPWGRGRYEIITRQVLRNHEAWDVRHAGEASS
jgi:hypothetical protein